jgi:hypothetical protein
MPKIYRINRLNIVVSVNEYGRKRRVNEFLAEYHRMTRCRIYGSLIGTSLHKEFYKTLSTCLHIWLMLLEGAY